MNTDNVASAFYARLFNGAAIVGGIGILASIVGAVIAPEQFFRGWLFGLQFWLGISLGCLAILMMHHLMGGAWGVATRRHFEAGAMVMPLMAFLFVPVLFGLPSIYLWARPAALAADPVLQHKASYLNPSSFAIRASVYVLLWSAMAFCFFRWSRAQDETTEAAPSRRMEALAGPGLLLLILSGSFAWMDWLMSVEPHWYSSIYPLMIMAGHALAAMALVVWMSSQIAGDAALAPVFTPKRFHDLGTLLFAFVFFWAYLCYAQLIVIWSGNLKDEIPWYLTRIVGGWSSIAGALFIFAFAIPFFLLLFRHLKRNPKTLGRIAFGAFLMQIVNSYWLIASPFQTNGPEFRWQYVAALVGVGGIWLACYARWMRQRPLLPVHAPGYVEALPHGAAQPA